MKDKTRRIIGWSFSALPLLGLLMGAIPKFVSESYKAQFLAACPNFTPIWAFGIVLLLAFALYLIPRTQVIGFALATGYLGGAAALAWQTQGFLMSLPVFALLILLWIGQAFLRPSLLRAATQ